jgi:hypothetical protein
MQDTENAGGTRGLERIPDKFVVWPVFARVIAVDVAHHVTQRGNARRFILECDADREVYLNLLWEDVGLRGVSLVGYCLMSNHVHLVAIPRSLMIYLWPCGTRLKSGKRTSHWERVVRYSVLQVFSVWTWVLILRVPRRSRRWRAMLGKSGPTSSKSFGLECLVAGPPLPLKTSNALPAIFARTKLFKSLYCSFFWWQPSG